MAKVAKGHSIKAKGYCDGVYDVIDCYGYGYSAWFVKVRKSTKVVLSKGPMPKCYRELQLVSCD